MAETEGRVGGEGGEAEGEAVGGEVEGQAGEVEVDDAEVGGDGQQQGERPTHFWGEVATSVVKAEAESLKRGVSQQTIGYAQQVFW